MEKILKRTHFNYIIAILGKTFIRCVQHQYYYLVRKQTNVYAKIKH